MLNYLCQSVAIVENTTDHYSWGNATEDEPAFLVYIGFRSREEAIALKNTLLKFYRCSDVTLRPAKRMSFEWEIKARGMQRYTDTYAFGLDYLIEGQHMQEWEEPEDWKHLAYFDSAWAS